MNASAAPAPRARGAAAWRRAEPDFGLFTVLLNIIGVAALAYGLYTLRTTEIGGVMGPAIGGMASQLSVTALPAVAVALARIGTPSAVEVLQNAATSGSRGVRAAARPMLTRALRASGS